MEKEIVISAPKGYEVDKDKSTFEKIIFKPIKANRQWSDFPRDQINGYFINSISQVCKFANTRDQDGVMHSHKNIWPTKELAEAVLALCQLTQWRKYYLASNNYSDWKPDFSNSMKSCWCIVVSIQQICVLQISITNNILSFPSNKMAEEFKTEFKELLETAKPLL